AESALHAAVSLDPQSVRLHNNLGHIFLLEKKMDAAEVEFRKALDLDPASATARNNLGVVLGLRGDLEGALEQFQVVGDAATADNNLAVVLMEAGKYEQSLEELGRALAIRQNFAPALANYKLAHDRLTERPQNVESKKTP